MGLRVESFKVWLRAEYAPGSLRAAEPPREAAPKRLRARFTIHCHAADGSPLTVPYGELIPAGANLAGVAPEAFEVIS